jgi:hypothetical protein
VSGAAEGFRPIDGRHVTDAPPPRIRRVGARAEVATSRLVRLFVVAALVLTAVAAAAFRLVGLFDVGFNSDEAVYTGQAAALAQDPTLSQLFPVFRAHPLLIQSSLAVPFAIVPGELMPRLVAALWGLATVVLVMRLGWELFGRSVGVLAALLVAVMPYHVMVSRQFLLDGPMTFLTTLTLYALARYARTGEAAWLTATGAALGLAVLAKETAGVLLGSIFVFFALSPEVPVRMRTLARGPVAMLVIAAAFPIALIASGGAGRGTAQEYFVWQLLRRPNHDLLFYAQVVPPAIGPLLLAAALAGLWIRRRWFGWRERLLLSWVVVPVVFFELWPTKGFQYLLPAAPALALLAAAAVASIKVGRLSRIVRSAVAAVLIASLAIPAAGLLAASSLPMAGAGGMPAGREAGRWIADNAVEGSAMLTIGPSMANVLQFYGGHRASGLSVSPNPLRRNPSYEPVLNPDLAVRRGEYRYIVWDAISASRTPRFSSRLLELVRRFDARLVAQFGPNLVRVYEVPAPRQGAGGSVTGPSDPAVTVAVAGPPPVRRIGAVFVAYGTALALALLSFAVAVRAEHRRVRS